MFVLDDVTAPRLDGGPGRGFDVAVDRGLLHCLPCRASGRRTHRRHRAGRPGGTLLVIAHAPGTQLGTTPLTADELRALLPAFSVTRTTPTMLAGAAAQLFELERQAD